MTAAYPSPTTDVVLDIDDDNIDDLTAGKLVTVGENSPWIIANHSIHLKVMLSMENTMPRR